MVQRYFLSKHSLLALIFPKDEALICDQLLEKIPFKLLSTNSRVSPTRPQLSLYPLYSTFSFLSPIQILKILQQLTLYRIF